MSSKAKVLWCTHRPKEETAKLVWQGQALLRRKSSSHEGLPWIIDYSWLNQGNRVYSIDGKAVSQTATSGGLGSNTGLYAIPIKFEDGKPTIAISGADGKEHKVYEVKRGFITFRGKEYKISLADGFYIIRKLTVPECMRLQTIPDWYDFSIVKNTHAYEMLGNGWTVEVIKYLISHTLEWILQRRMII